MKTQVRKIKQNKIMTNEGREERETKLNKEGKDGTFKNMRIISHQT